MKKYNHDRPQGTSTKPSTYSIWILAPYPRGRRNHYRQIFDEWMDRWRRVELFCHFATEYFLIFNFVNWDIEIDTSNVCISSILRKLISIFACVLLYFCISAVTETRSRSKSSSSSRSRSRNRSRRKYEEMYKKGQPSQQQRTFLLN